MSARSGTSSTTSSASILCVWFLAIGYSWKRNLSTWVEHFAHRITEAAPHLSSGFFIHKAVGRAGDCGIWRTNRSGWAAWASARTADRGPAVSYTHLRAHE